MTHFFFMNSLLGWKLKEVLYKII